MHLARGQNVQSGDPITFPKYKSKQKQCLVISVFGDGSRHMLASLYPINKCLENFYRNSQERETKRL